MDGPVLTEAPSGAKSLVWAPEASEALVEEPRM